MAPFVDGFVLVVPKRCLAAHRRLARIAAKLWPELGPLECRVCVDALVMGDPRSPASRAGRTLPAAPARMLHGAFETLVAA
ncbi:MAG: DUF1428 family protein [Planctomycetes bacterium]|nr:DUF1428 family protein [Planctomycetota bacterium]